MREQTSLVYRPARLHAELIPRYVVAQRVTRKTKSNNAEVNRFQTVLSHFNQPQALV